MKNCQVGLGEKVIGTNEIFQNPDQTGTCAFRHSATRIGAKHIRIVIPM